MVDDLTGRGSNGPGKEIRPDGYGHSRVPQEPGPSAVPGESTQRRREEDGQPFIFIERFTNQDNCFKLTRAWGPEYGVPALIYRDFKSNEDRRIMTRLFYYGVARIPRHGTRKNGATLRQFKEDTRQIKRVRRAVSFQAVQRDKDGNEYAAWRNLAEAIRVLPEYLYQIINYEHNERRYQFGTNRRYYQRSYPPPVIGYPELSEYLRSGTGLYPNHGRIIEALYGEVKPGHWIDERAFVDAIYKDFMDALTAWRILSRCRAGEEIRPRWKVSPKDGRLYASRPNLQGIPGALRPACFIDEHGWPVAEVDISSFFVNLALIEQGRKPIPDFWKYAAAILRDMGYRITDKQASELGNEIFGGCNKGLFCKRYRGILADPAAFCETFRRILPAPGNHNELSKKGAAIMERVLLDMMNAGIPSGLIVHDSIVTAYPEKVRAFIEDASDRITGHSLDVKIEGV